MIVDIYLAGRDEAIRLSQRIVNIDLKGGDFPRYVFWEDGGDVCAEYATDAVSKLVIQ